jgi:tetratricopeptide (TPR) repeat protein
MKKRIITAMVFMIFTLNLIANNDVEIKRGIVIYESAKFEEAIEHFEKLEKKVKDSSDLYLWIAKSYLSNINNVSFFTKATYSSRIQDNLELSIEKDPKNVEARIYMAQYKFNAPSIGGGDKDEAWKQANEISKLSPSKGAEIKVQFYTQEEQFDKAMEECDKLAASEKNNTHAYYLKGMLYQQMKKYPEALSQFEKAVSIDENEMGSLYQIGRNAVFSQKELEKGIEALSKYLTLKPDSNFPQTDAAYWRLAMIYQIKNDREKAKEYVQKALAINPDNKDYKKLLEELK